MSHVPMKSVWSRGGKMWDSRSPTAGHPWTPAGCFLGLMLRRGCTPSLLWQGTSWVRSSHHQGLPPQCKMLPREFRHPGGLFPPQAGTAGPTVLLQEARGAVQRGRGGKVGLRRPLEKDVQAVSREGWCLQVLCRGTESQVWKGCMEVSSPTPCLKQGRLLRA